MQEKKNTLIELRTTHQEEQQRLRELMIALETEILGAGGFLKLGYSFDEASFGRMLDMVKQARAILNLPHDLVLYREERTGDIIVIQESESEV